MTEYLDAWERAKAQTIRVMALGLDALVDQGISLRQEEYQAALEEAARRGFGLVAESAPRYPGVIAAVIDKVLAEFREQRVQVDISPAASSQPRT